MYMFAIVLKCFDYVCFMFLVPARAEGRKTLDLDHLHQQRSSKGLGLCSSSLGTVGQGGERLLSIAGVTPVRAVVVGRRGHHFIDGACPGLFMMPAW